MSIEASGSLGNAMTFAKTKGTAYAKKHSTPANPRSGAQTGVRAGMKFITQLWAQLSDAEKASFGDLAELYNTSPYHAFLHLNSQRWAKHLLPIADFSSDETNENRATNLAGSYQNGVYTLWGSITTVTEQPLSVETCANINPAFTPTRQDTKIIMRAVQQTNPHIYAYQGFFKSPIFYPYRYRTRYGNVSGNTSDWELDGT